MDPKRLEEVIQRIIDLQPTKRICGEMKISPRDVSDIKKVHLDVIIRRKPIQLVLFGELPRYRRIK